MKTQKKILVPTDFSERANNALKQAILLANKINGQLIIYHVFHRPMTDGNQTSTLLHLEKNIDAKFKELAKGNHGLDKIPHEFRKALGTSIDKIEEITKEESIDTIVMATKGAKGFDELWGTKTAKIIKRVEVPVFVIPDNTSLDQFKKISLACDYSVSTDFDEIAFLIELAEKLQLTIDVVTLNRDEKTMTRQELSYREMLIGQLEKVKSSFTFTQRPNIEKGIIEYSQTNNIDVIAILPKSYTFIERLFHESLTDKMVFHSPLPLLVLK